MKYLSSRSLPVSSWMYGRAAYMIWRAWVGRVPWALALRYASSMISHAASLIVVVRLACRVMRARRFSGFDC